MMALFLVRSCRYSTVSTGLARRVSSNLVPRECYSAVLKRLEEDTHSYFRNRHVSNNCRPSELISHSLVSVTQTTSGSKLAWGEI